MRIQFTGTTQESHPFMSTSGTTQHVKLRFHAPLCKSPHNFMINTGSSNAFRLHKFKSVFYTDT